eukprot:jgi/Botrbrau1/9157/Bobra.160_3s0029.1
MCQTPTSLKPARPAAVVATPDCLAGSVVSASEGTPRPPTLAFSKRVAWIIEVETVGAS